MNTKTSEWWSETKSARDRYCHVLCRTKPFDLTLIDLFPIRCSPCRSIALSRQQWRVCNRLQQPADVGSSNKTTKYIKTAIARFPLSSHDSSLGNNLSIYWNSILYWPNVLCVCAVCDHIINRNAIISNKECVMGPLWQVILVTQGNNKNAEISCAIVLQTV